MMMLSQAAKALNTEICGTDVGFSAVSKDTRHCHPGDLYIALKGEHFDGHDFIPQAEQAGAVAALVSKQQRGKLPQLCVTDTRYALGQLAAYWLQQWRQPLTGQPPGASNNPDLSNRPGLLTHKLIAITGSNGKTTVKEMCRHILIQSAGSEKVLATQGNLNNDIGMPLTVLGLRASHQYAVIEMGASHMGEIKALSAIGKPDIALITNAAAAHLEGFGSIENVATAKAEIFSGLSDAGVAVINADDPYAGMWLEQTARNRRLLFSIKNKHADVFAEKISADSYRIITTQGNFEMQLPVPGKHNVMNALAATAICCAIGIDLINIRHGLNSFENIAGRLKMKVGTNGSRIIDDSYNANPLSVQAAIDVLVEQTGKKILVLGDMAELGKAAAKLHTQIGVYARQAGIEILYATGNNSKYTVEAFGQGAKYFSTRTALIQSLLAGLTGDEIILVKGSRSAAMDKVVTALLSGNHNVNGNNNTEKGDTCYSH